MNCWTAVCVSVQVWVGILNLDLLESLNLPALLSTKPDDQNSLIVYLSFKKNSEVLTISFSDI